MTTIRIIIPGTPIPKGRPRFGRGRVYTDDKTASYERAVGLYARRAMEGEQPYDCPMEMRAQFVFEPPAWWTKQSKTKVRKAIAGEIECTNAVDVDNLVKSLADSCNRIVYVDDKQIVKITATKVYGPKAMTIVDFMPRIRPAKEAA